MKHVNACDGVYRSFDIHFTSACDNKCQFCIDKQSRKLAVARPQWKKMANTVFLHSLKIDDILILGGEPFLYIAELYSFIREVKNLAPNLKIFLTTGMPKTVYDNYPLFVDILKMLDGMNVSMHHYDLAKSDAVRGTKTDYPRHELYAKLPKDKVRINLNLVKGILDSKQEIERAVQLFADFHSIKLAELQHAPDQYVSFEDVMGIKLHSPYWHGCQTDISHLFSAEGTAGRPNVILKRSCFLLEPSRKASFLDGIKAIKNSLFPPSVKFGVVFEDGNLYSNWESKCGRD